MSEGLGARIKRAFKWHWNLLAVGAGVAYGLISGHHDMILPAVAAGEILYLGTLGLNARFQNVLRGKAWSDRAKALSLDMEERYRKLLSFLSPKDSMRFAMLRDRCARLLHLRKQINPEEATDELESESLDRMLWLYLKLLREKSGLEQFLGGTQRAQIERELKAAEVALADSEQREKSAGAESRLAETNRERVKTIKERIANYEKAYADLELANAEIEKTEQQITHLCEVGMTSRDSASLGAQIDSISESLRISQEAFSVPGMSPLEEDLEEAAPRFLSGESPLPPPIVERVREQ